MFHLVSTYFVLVSSQKSNEPLTAKAGLSSLREKASGLEQDFSKLALSEHSLEKGTWGSDSHGTLAERLQPCPALCDPMDCGPPGSSVRGISKARRLEWVAISSSRGSSQPRD